MKSNDFRKVRRLRLLMVLSQVLLVTFLVQWLYHEYFDEQSRLQKDLTQLFFTTQSELTDSAVYKQLVVPALQGRDGRTLEVHIKKTEERKLVQYEHTIEDSKIVRLKSDAGAGTRTFPNRKMQISTSDTILVRQTDPRLGQMTQGIKVLINRLSMDSLGLVRIDSLQFKKEFGHRLQDSGYDVDISWLPVPGNAILLPALNGSSKKMGVTGYQLLLFRRILPELLFAALLLGITSTALVAVYKSYRSQQRLNLMKNDLVSNMTHELKTPIATIKVALEALDSFDRINDPVTSREYLRMAASEIERLELLVSQALNHSLLETGRLHIHPERLDLQSLIRQTIGSLQPKLDAHNARLDISVNGDYFYADIDRLHIQGLLLNLIDNSLKYTSGAPVIHIELTEEPGYLVVRVDDNGPGIPPEYLDRVFEKFFRVPTGDIHQVNGYGLGLSYAKQIAELHGGSIVVENNRDGGCSFSIRLKKSLL